MLLLLKGSGDWSKGECSESNLTNHVSSAMEEPLDLQAHAEGEGTHVKLRAEEMELAERSDSVGNDQLALAEGVTAAEKSTGVESEIMNECLNQRSSSDQLSLTMASGKSSGLERADLNDRSHGNKKLSRPEPLAGDEVTQRGASNCLQFQPGTAEYTGACAVPVSTHPKTLMLKNVCVSAAFPCNDHHVIEFEDDENNDLKNMVEEFDRSAANALSIGAGKIALASREVRLGVSERAYSAGGTLLHSLSRSTTQIVSSFNI